MADVSISSVASSNTARGMRAVAFTRLDDQVGYFFFSASTSAGLFYTKTTDGGATWGTAVLVSSAVTPGAFDIWADWWTPGNTGTRISFWSFDVTADDVIYRYLDTASDTLSTPVIVFTGATSVLGRGVFVSGTRTLSGLLYCAFDIDAGAEKGLYRSNDADGSGWGSLSPTFVEATLDEAMLFPASNTGDSFDCWAIYHDTSANALTLKMWDSSAVSPVESATIQTFLENVTDLTGQFGFSGSIRHSDGHLIMSAVSERDTATADHQAWDINGTGSITALTAITTNIDDHYYPQVFIDQLTDDIYVAFNGLRAGTETLGTTSKVYYTKSTDGGTTWSANSAAYMEGATAAVFQVWAPLSGSRFYVGWRVASTIVGNKVNSLTFAASGYTLQAAIGVFVLAGQPAGLKVERRLAAEAGAFVMSGKAASLERGYKVGAEVGTFALAGQAATLRVSRRISAAAGAFNFTGIAARLIQSRSMDAEAGVFNLAGQAATLRYSRKVLAAVGTFNLTGVTALLLRGRRVNAQLGVFALAGQPAGLRAGRRITASPGAFVMTGSAAGLRRAARLLAAPGAFALTGQIARLLRGRRVAADAGAFVLMGQAADLIYDAASAILTAAPGAFVFTGQAATLRRGRVVKADVGVFDFAGSNAELKTQRQLQAEAGAFNLTGNDAQLVRHAILEAETGVFVLVGQLSGGVRAYRLGAEPGHFVFTGMDVGLVYVPLVMAVFDGEVSIYPMFDGAVELFEMLAGEIEMSAAFDGDVLISQEREGETETGPMLTGVVQTLPGA